MTYTLTQNKNIIKPLQIIEGCKEIPNQQYSKFKIILCQKIKVVKKWNKEFHLVLLLINWSGYHF